MVYLFPIFFCDKHIHYKEDLIFNTLQLFLTQHFVLKSTSKLYRVSLNFEVIFKDMYIFVYLQFFIC